MIIKAENNQRIDTYLVNELDYSRSKIEKHIKDGKVKANGKIVKKSYQLKIDDEIEIEEIKEEQMDVQPEDLNLKIVYEDDDIIVVDKENGMVVHPAVGNYSGTLVNGLMNHSLNLSKINGEFRPGIVHRIDAFTTGLLVVAKNDKAHMNLAKQFEKHSITRKYIALVWGIMKSDTATIDAPIGRDQNDRKKMAVTSVNSKKAITHVKVIERFSNVTLVELTLETGRTHQIRVHMNYIGYPVVNDSVYGKRKKIDNSGQCLHAEKLGFIHPTTNEYMEFTSPLPSCFVNILDQFKNS